jgi:hypothetical protein
MQKAYPDLSPEKIKALIDSRKDVMMMAATLNSNFIGRDYWRDKAEYDGISMSIEIFDIFINDTFECYSDTWIFTHIFKSRVCFWVFVFCLILLVEIIGVIKQNMKECEEGEVSKEAHSFWLVQPSLVYSIESISNANNCWIFFRS